ncbi:MAG: acylphosphatase [Archaeoglobaceae archaeon]
MGKRVIIKGERVHGVGYRPFLLGIASSLNINNFFADNDRENGTQLVDVLLRDDKSKIEAFIQTVSEKYPENAIVDELKVDDYQGNVMDIESYYRYLTATQLSKVATYGGQMLKKQDKSLNNQQKMIGNQEKMLNKQDNALDTQQKMIGNQEKMLGNQEKMLDKQDKSLNNQEKMLGNQEKMLDKQNKSLNNQENMLGNQEKMLGKQDKSLNNQENMLGNQEKMLGKQDKSLNNQQKMLEKQDITIGEVKKTREDLKVEVRSVKSSVDEGSVDAERRSTC